MWRAPSPVDEMGLEALDIGPPNNGNFVNYIAIYQVK